MFAPVERVVDRARGTNLGGLIKDTFWVAAWQSAGTIVEFTLIALLTHELGLAEYGRYTILIATVALVGEFFSLRVGIATTTFAADKLRRDDRGAAGIVQLGFLAEGAGALAAIVLICGLAPFVGNDLIGDDGVLILSLYSLTLLTGSIERPCLAILRLLNRFRLITGFTALQELGRLVLVLVAVLIFHSLVAVVAALAIARLGAGVVTATVASVVFSRASGGVRLTSPAIGSVSRKEKRGMLKTVFHTNVIAYSKLVQFQLPTVLLGAMLGPTQTGIYKVGTAAASVLGKLVDPAAAALLPRLSRLWAAGRKPELRRLIEQASMITLPIVIVGGIVLVYFRDSILDLLGGGQAAQEAGTVFIYGVIGQALYVASFWRSTVLFAAHRASAVSFVAVSASAVQLVAFFALVPLIGIEGAAIALLINRALSMAFLTSIAVKVLRDPDSGSPQRRSEPGAPALARRA